MTTGNLQEGKCKGNYFFFFYFRQEGRGKYSNRIKIKKKEKKRKSLIFYDSFLLLPVVVDLKLESPDSECIYVPF